MKIFHSIRTMDLTFLDFILWGTYRMFIVQAYQTSQYVVPRGSIFLRKWCSSFAGNSDGKMNVQSACALNTRYKTRWTFRHCWNSKTQLRQLLERNQPKCSNLFGPRQMTLLFLYLPQYKNCTHEHAMSICNATRTADSRLFCDIVAALQREYVGSPPSSEVGLYMYSRLMHPYKNFHFRF
jgi:hypothetical protein